MTICWICQTPITDERKMTRYRGEPIHKGCKGQVMWPDGGQHV